MILALAQAGGMTQGSIGTPLVSLCCVCNPRLCSPACACFMRRGAGHFALSMGKPDDWERVWDISTMVDTKEQFLDSLQHAGLVRWAGGGVGASTRQPKRGAGKAAASADQAEQGRGSSMPAAVHVPAHL